VLITRDLSENIKKHGRKLLQVAYVMLVALKLIV